MKQKILILLLGFFLFNQSFSQDLKKYYELIKEAIDLKKSQEYYKSGLKFSEAFSLYNKKEMLEDRYNSACSWALANEPDSSFAQLFTIANYKEISLYYNYFLSDSDFKSLYKDKRWSEFISILKAKKEKGEAILDIELVAFLDTIHQDDQKYRIQIDEIEKKHGWESDEMKAHWEIIIEKDSINLIKIKKILDEKGWLGADIIGIQGNITLFLVIQHSDFETQLKYLPMMREAVKKGNAYPRNLALLEDRVALRRGERQIYGSQIGRDPETGEYYVSPLIDPENVDKRRAEVGLGTIADYINHWGMTWDIKKHKERTAIIEAEKQKNNEIPTKLY